MKNRIPNIKYIILICSSFIVYLSMAQQAAVSGGGQIQGAGGNISISIGQAFYHRINNDNHQINEGVLQPAENSELNQWLGGNAEYPNDWNTASNWSFMHIPENENVLVGNQPYLPHISTSANCNNLNINEGGSVRINSTASQTGSLIINGNCLLSDDAEIIAERYIPESKYHYISAPISYENTDFMSEIQTSNDALGYMGLDIDEISGNIPTDNFWLWNETSGYWEDLLHSNRMESQTMEDARGYVYGNNESNTLIMKGETNTDNVSYNAAYSPDGGNGFHLVGNPFCCDIAINTAADESHNFLADNAAILDDNYEAIYLWQEIDNWTGGDCYKVICNNGFCGTNNGNALENDFVEMGQAFMVKTDQAGSLIFYKNIRKHGESDFCKSKNNWPGIQLFIENERTKSSTLIGFNSEMNTGLDPGFDAGSMKGGNEINLFSFLPDENHQAFAVQALPFSAEEIELGVEIEKSGEYTFSAYEENMKEIWFEDRLNNTKTDFKHSGEYKVFLSEGESVGRFFLHFKAETISVPNQNEKDNKKIFVRNRQLVLVGIKGEICVFDISGRLLHQLTAINKIESFSLNLPHGIYVVETAGKSLKVAF